MNWWRRRATTQSGELSHSDEIQCYAVIGTARIKLLTRIKMNNKFIQVLVQQLPLLAT